MVQLRQPTLGQADHTQPLYQQIEATLKEMIDDVEFGPGDRIPSERELAEMLDVSRMTVRRAVENLIQMGLLERRSTSGTFVREARVVRKVGSPAQGLTQMLESDGVKPGTKLLSFEIIRAPRKVAKKLELRIGDQVVKICRLRLMQQMPFCIETSYLPLSLVPGMSGSELENNESLYALLQQRYNLDLASSDGKITLSRCMADEADLLDLEIGDPVLFLHAIIRNKANQPIEYLKSVNHPDWVAFRTYQEM